MASINTSLNRSIDAVGDQGAGVLSYVIDNPFVNKLIQIIMAIGLVIFLIFVSRIIANYIRAKISQNFILKEGEEVRKIGTLVADVVFYAMTMFSLYIGFKMIGFDIGLLIGGLAIGIGFAFRETLSNMISGIVIFSTKEFQLGNVIEIKVPGQLILGRVEEVTMRYVILRTFELRRVIVPNTRFLKSLVRTYSAEDYMKTDMDFTIEAPTNIEKILQITKETINGFDFVIHKEFTQVLLDAFSEKSIKVKTVFCFDPNAGSSIPTLRSKVNEKLYGLYKEIKTGKVSLTSSEAKPQEPKLQIPEVATVPQVISTTTPLTPVSNTNTSPTV